LKFFADLFCVLRVFVVNFKLMRDISPPPVIARTRASLRLALITAVVLVSAAAIPPQPVTINVQASPVQPSWEGIAAGLAYVPSVAVTARGSVPVHVMRVDLNQVALKPLMSPHFSSALRVEDFASRTPGALAIFNGSFFDESDQGREIPKGIVVSEGKVHQNLLRSEPWAVFFINRQGAHIVSPRTYRHSVNTQFALQGFPRLVEQRRVLRFKPQLSQRTALGILGPKTLLVLVTRDGASLSLQELAQTLRERGCQSALNLDGGSSTQLWLRKPGSSPLIEHGSNRVPVAIGVFPRR
jgi:hypothetical protein